MHNWKDVSVRILQALHSSVCYISEIDLGRVWYHESMWCLFEKFHFGSCQPNINATLHAAETYVGDSGTALPKFYAAKSIELIMM
jgi:hypothetical protein